MKSMVPLVLLTSGVVVAFAARPVLGDVGDVGHKSTSHPMSCARAVSLFDAAQKLPVKPTDDIYVGGLHPSNAGYQVTVLAKVDPRGKSTSVSIEKSSGCALLDRAALRATAKMKWRSDKSNQANSIVWEVKDQ